MSQARTAFFAGFCGKVAAFLLILGLAVIWQSGEDARSQPRREIGGMASAVIHPDEGLRQIVHLVQKRGEDRKSGALPEPAALGCDTTAILAQPTPSRPSAAPRFWALPCAAPARLARAPPATGGLPQTGSTRI